MASAYDSDLEKKLNLKSGMKIRVVGRPEGVDLSGLAETECMEADCLLVFVRTLAEAESRSASVVAAAQVGGVVWMGYPKARQLGTDLNRDILWRQMETKGIRPVRQVSLNDTWSLIRFRAAD